jgi:methylmalonyl-CoA mutase N-terminal domain/subunit
MESLTDDLEAAILELMATVEAKGGAVAAIEEGFQKSEIERSAYAVNQQIDSGERTVVGLNKFRLDEEEAYEPLRVDPQIEADQRERLTQLRTTRDNSAVERALDALRAAAKGTDNALLPMREALAAKATVGEVCHALREVWGTYVPRDTF